MHFELDHIYHVYNRSNETVFYTHEQYEFFTAKMRKLIHPVCDILCWCLMPNHFHMLIMAREGSIRSTNEKHRPNLQVLSKNIGTLLSSYTLSLNKSMKRRGKLFSHNTQAKQITHKGNEYITWSFIYIHENPRAARLVQKLEDWPYSSFRDYKGLRDGTLCNKQLMQEILGFDHRLAL